jgi:hypothetical protein
MTFVQRYTAPLFARIPDLSDIPTGRMILIGIVISLLLHLFVFLMIPLVSLIFPDKGASFANEALKPREIELTVIPEAPPEPAFTLAPKPERLFMDSRGLDLAKDAPDNPLFDSDQNMHAASELPGTGDVPLPSQIGKERPFNAFETTRSLLGPMATPFAEETPFRPSPSTPADQTPPAPIVPPVPQIAQQVPPTTQKAANTPAPTPQTTEKKPPTETKEEQAKQKRLQQVKKMMEDEIALQKRESIPEAITAILKPVSTPPPVSHAAILRPLAEDMFKPATPVPRPQTADNQRAMLATPAPRPQPQHQAGYQPEQEKNHIEGSISNRGKNAVASVATPMAKYRKQVNDAIGSRWYYYIRDKMDLLAFGSVRISFFIDSKGHISRTRVESNSSNSSLAEVSMRAIEEAEIGPPPIDPSGATSEEPLDWTLTFTYYPFSQ